MLALLFVEQANAIISELYMAELMAGLTLDRSQQQQQYREDASTSGASTTAASMLGGSAVDVDEAVENKMLFDPRRGNVLFASAYDGWGCTVDDFAKLHAEK